MGARESVLGTLAAHRTVNAGPARVVGRTFALPVFASKTDTRRVARFISGSWATVRAALALRHEVADKDRAELFGVGRLRDDLTEGASRAKLDALASVQLVVLDLDSVTPEQFADVCARVQGLGVATLLYPTYSWAPDAPRWRLLVPLAQDADVAKYAALWRGLNRATGGHADINAHDVARRSYLHSCPIGASATRPEPIMFDGPLIGPERLAALAPDPGPPDAGRGVPGLQGRAPAGAGDASINAEALARDWSPADAEMIAAVGGCAVMADFKETGGAAWNGDGLWRGVVSVLRVCTGGEQLAHEWSAKDRRYDRAETQAKFDGWHGSGPALCRSIAEFPEASAKCAACPHWGKITTPAQLGVTAPAKAELKPNPDAPETIQARLESSGVRCVLGGDGVLYLVSGREAEGRTCRSVVAADAGAGTDLLMTQGADGAKAPSDRALLLFKARARQRLRERNESMPIWLRVGLAQGSDYAAHIDQGRPGRRVVVSAAGVQPADDAAPDVLLRRVDGAGVLPEPVAFASADEALHELLSTMGDDFGLKGDAALLLVGTLLEWLRPNTPHPIVEIVGTAGSGKSSLGDFVRGLIDPVEGARVTMGARVEDVAAAAQRHYLLTLDNASGRLDRTLSDALCTVSTGGTLLVRQLYTNGEVAPLKLHRPLLVTAVSPVCTAADLQDRVVRIELAARSGGNVAEEDLRAAWEAQRGRAVGALYALLAGALRELPEVKRRPRSDWDHRLVDWLQLGEAMLAAAMGERGRGKFLAAAKRARQAKAARTASGDRFLLALLVALRKVAAAPTHEAAPSLREVVQRSPAVAAWPIDGGGAGILARMEALHRLLPAGSTFDRDGAIPATARALADAIRRVHPTLLPLGIEAQELRFGSRPLLQFVFTARGLRDE